MPRFSLMTAAGSGACREDVTWTRPGAGHRRAAVGAGPARLLGMVLAVVAAFATLDRGALAGPEEAPAGAMESPEEMEGSAALETTDAGEAEAAEGPSSVASGWSGPGFYMSTLKILACWLVFLLWVAMADWLSRDCQAKKMGYTQWNPIVVGTFLVAFLLVLLIPMFAVGFPLLVIAAMAPFSTYVIMRNKRVEKHERVFTPDHIRHWMARKVSASAAAAQAEAAVADPHQAGPPVVLTARGGATERDDRANLLAARQAPGFRDARILVADGMSRRADAIMLDYTQQGVGVRYQVDGVWHNAEPLERETADPMLEAMKTLCGLNWEDRQSRQQGAFTAEFESAKYAATFASQGTQTGERVVMQFEGKKTRFNTLADVGMRPKMQEELRELLGGNKGLVLLSAMPASGLRSTTTVVLRAMDRLVRDFTSVEDARNRYEDVENIKIMTYNSAAGETPLTILRKVFLEEPEVVIIRDLVNGEVVSDVCEEISSVGRLVVSTVRAKDAAEALLRVLAMKVPAAEFAESVIAVLNQRLVRKLCEHCREAYVPPPQVLQQLGIPPGRVDVFYRPPQQPEEVCEVCSGIGYIGRTAIFELLRVGDKVRNALVSTPKLDAVRQAARQAGMRTLQEEGIVLVAKGATSLPELMRVLKQ